MQRRKIKRRMASIQVKTRLCIPYTTQVLCGRRSRWCDAKFRICTQASQTLGLIGVLSSEYERYMKSLGSIHFLSSNSVVSCVKIAKSVFLCIFCRIFEQMESLSKELNALKKRIKCTIQSWFCQNYLNSYFLSQCLYKLL